MEQADGRVYGVNIQHQLPDLGLRHFQLVGDLLALTQQAMQYGVACVHGPILGPGQSSIYFPVVAGAT